MVKHVPVANTGGPARKLILPAIEHDPVGFAIAIAAIIMLVGTAGTVMPEIVRELTGHGGGPDRVLTNALLLNIALVLLGWRRYADLAREVQERRAAEIQARRLADSDPLTGCLNRRSIATHSAALIAEATQAGKATALFMLDLDGFKQINDVRGHHAGDVLLCETARRIEALLPADALLARIGGDEFACVIPFDPARRELVDDLATRLISAISRPVPYDDAELETTISLGITRSDRHDRDCDAQTLLNMADIAMYHAKNHGRNCYFWFDPAMETELRFRSELEGGIRRGIALGEFVPCYEKQIDLATGEIVGFEMLPRWNSARLGLVSPEIFVPVAERIGVIAELSKTLIRQALADARRWDPSLTLSVNISPVQMRDPWFAQKILKLLVEANFPPERLEIEIAESGLHENLPLVRSLITSLKNQGIKVSLDDFGRGYSSLTQLNSLPFDRIKIDRSFITQLPESRDCAMIVRSIAALGDGLGLPITAEGVETAEVLGALTQIGSFKAQGQFFGQPQTGENTHVELARLGLLTPEPDDAIEARSDNGDDPAVPLAGTL